MDSLLQGLIQTLPEQVSPTSCDGRIVLVDEKDPILFWNAFIGAMQNGQFIALFDPTWPDSWKSDYRQMVENERADQTCKVLIPTSGTTGKPRFCIHSRESLSASARAFSRKFSPGGIIHSVNVLPQHHVGGLMPVFRSAISGGKTIFANYTDDIAGLDPPFALDQACISLVPTQLNRMLQSPSQTKGLRQFGMILVGGAGCPIPLLERCRDAGLRLAPCYGSTETAALVTVLDPNDFQQGNNSVGKPLPGMEVSIDEEGVVQIWSDSVQLGYLPKSRDFQRDPYRTSDLGQLIDDGFLHVNGRVDRIIITGGKKVIPEQVESICMASGLVADAWCTGIPDPDWGTRVELSVVPQAAGEDIMNHLGSLLREQLPPYAVPKIINPVSSITRNDLGKRIHRS